MAKTRKEYNETFKAKHPNYSEFKGVSDVHSDVAYNRFSGLVSLERGMSALELLICEALILDRWCGRLSFEELLGAVLDVKGAASAAEQG